VKVTAQTVFSIGATLGIGRATALAFVRSGANVALIGRDADRGRTSTAGRRPLLPMMLILAILAAWQPAPARERDAAATSVADVGRLLVGRYDNRAQVAQGKKGETPAPQHVTITIEPTQQAEWELWRIHMDVDPAVAESAGSDTSLDAVWAMNISRVPNDNSLQLVPYSLNPSVHAATVNGSTFDKTQWFSLEACALHGDFGKSHIVVQVPPDEMCVVDAMGLGGKRAFLPSWIERSGEWLHAQLMYFGKPWRVDARRVSTPTARLSMTASAAKR